jgi:hypothetical protein
MKDIPTWESSDGSSIFSLFLYLSIYLSIYLYLYLYLVWGTSDKYAN